MRLRPTDNTTSLGSGDRVAKHDPRVAAYGTVDEANAAIGIARLHVDAELDAVLGRIQNDLFDLGADLCIPQAKTVESQKPAHAPLRIVAEQVDWLEAAIDELNADLEPLRSFVLPGGTPAAAALHQARAICRRAERAIVALGEHEALNAAPRQYVNRLSDLLFVLARVLNRADGGTDVLWQHDRGAH